MALALAEEAAFKPEVGGGGGGANWGGGGTAPDGDEPDGFTGAVPGGGPGAKPFLATEGADAECCRGTKSAGGGGGASCGGGGMEAAWAAAAVAAVVPAVVEAVVPEAAAAAAVAEVVVLGVIMTLKLLVFFVCRMLLGLLVVEVEVVGSACWGVAAGS